MSYFKSGSDGMPADPVNPILDCAIQINQIKENFAAAGFTEEQAFSLVKIYFSFWLSTSYLKMPDS